MDLAGALRLALDRDLRPLGELAELQGGELDPHEDVALLEPAPGDVEVGQGLVVRAAVGVGVRLAATALERAGVVLAAPAVTVSGGAAVHVGGTRVGPLCWSYAPSLA